MAFRVHAIVEHASNQYFSFTWGDCDRPIKEHMSCCPSPRCGVPDMKRAPSRTKLVARFGPEAEGIGCDAFRRRHEKVEVAFLLQRGKQSFGLFEDGPDVGLRQR